MKQRNISFQTRRRLIFGLVLSAFVVGCGFQLNFNRRQLSAAAYSISIKEIHNSTFLPAADIWLKKLLTEEFLKHSIKIADPNSGDLELSFKITSAKISREAYSLDTGQQTYEFVFSISGELTVRNNIKESLYIDAFDISGSHAIKTAIPELPPMKIKEGRSKALVNLKEKIFSSLTQDF